MIFTYNLDSLGMDVVCSLPCLLLAVVGLWLVWALAPRLLSASQQQDTKILHPGQLPTQSLEIQCFIILDQRPSGPAFYESNKQCFIIEQYDHMTLRFEDPSKLKFVKIFWQSDLFLCFAFDPSCLFKCGMIHDPPPCQEN